MNNTTFYSLSKIYLHRADRNIQIFEGMRKPFHDDAIEHRPKC